MRKALALIVCLLLLYGCIVRAPKYTRGERVMQLKTGMTQRQVDSLLQVKPYSLKSLDTSHHYVLIYKFRPEERRTLPFLLKDTNGREVRGTFMDLHAYFNASDTLYRIEAMESSTQTEEKKINIDKIITFLTVTAPAVAVAIGLSKTD